VSEEHIMDQTAYGIGISTDLGMEGAEQAARDALAAEGFGVLTEIDVKATMKAKLGIDRAPYKILGACNPVLADRALGVDEHIGLLLPCNVIVYEGETGTRIEAMEPAIMSRMVEDPAIEPIAAEARQRLIRALETIEVSG
jgi:uncharacterized protein (DUF302 family)